MSQTIDSKVVELKFDNSQFENNVQTSINSLDQLKSSLNMDGVTDSLSNISKAAKDVDVSALNDSVEEVSVSFSALDVMATTVLANITNSAINAGKSLVSSLTNMFVQGGWQRSANIEQAEFRLEGLGMDVEEVMANANTAVKGTAYGLDQAAKAASVFGASGIQAGDEMTSVLRSVAGVAAMTGDEYDNIANIFESVAGTGRLMTQQMRQLESRGLNVAATMGDILGYTEQEIRDMVTAGEIDFETFSTCMDEAFGEHAQDANKTFSGALSNMKAAMSRFGADIFTPFRENMRDVFNTLTPLIDALHASCGGVIDNLVDIMGNLSAKLINVIDKLTDFIENFKMADETSENLRNTFKGLWSFLDLLGQGFVAIVKVVGELLTFLAPVGRAILSVTGAIGSWITEIDEAVKESEFFTKASSTIIGWLEQLKSAFGNARDRIADAFDCAPLEVFQALLERIRTRMSSFGESFSGLGNSSFMEFLTTLGKTFTDALANSIQKFSNGMSNFITKLGNADFSGIIDLLNTIGISAIAVGFGKLERSIGKLTKSINILGSLKEVLRAYSQELKATALLEIAVAVAVLAGSVIALSFIDSKKLAVSVSALGSLFGELTGAMALIGKTNWNKSIKSMISIVTLTKAIKKLAESCAILGELDWNGLIKGITGVSVFFGEIYGFIYGISKMKGSSKQISQMFTIAVSMVVLAEAIRMLAKTAMIFADMSWNELAKGLSGVTVLLGELYGFIYGITKLKFKLNTGKQLMSIAASMVILAAAIKMLTSACTTFSGMSWNELAKGLSGITVLLAELYGFIYGMSKINSDTKLMSIAASMVVLALAIKVLISACVTFSGMNWEELAKGLIGVGGLLAELAIFIGVLSGMDLGGAKMVKIGLAMIEVAVSIKILGSAVQEFGSMSWGEVARGLLSMAGALTEMCAAMLVLSVIDMAGGKLMKTVSAIQLFATAMLTLAPAMVILGSMSWNGVATSLITIAGALTILGVAGMLLQPVSGVIVALSASLALIGAAVLMFGGGIELCGLGLISLSAGLTAFATAMTVSGAEIVAGISAIILGIVSLVPSIITGIIEGIQSVWGVLVDFIKEIILSLLDVITELIPEMVDGILQMINTICTSLAEYAPQIVDSLMVMVTSILDSLTSKMPEIADSVKALVHELFDDIFTDMDTEGLVELAISIGLIAVVIEKIANFKVNLKTAVKNVAEFGILVAELSGVLALVGQMTEIPGLENGIDKAAELLEGLGNAIGQFIGGLIGGIAEGICDSLPDMATDLSDFMTNLGPFLDGASQIDPSIASSIAALASGILAITKAEVIDGIASWIVGSSTIEDFADSITILGPALGKFAEDTAGIDGGNVESCANAAKALAEFADAIPKEGGLAAIFGGENAHSLADFGVALEEFGPHMKNFADSVEGIDAQAVTSSANAAEALAEFADAIPKEGGLAALFGGENSLADFGVALEEFGGHFANYISEVEGITEEDVEASTNAAMILAEFANTIPNEGGLAGFFGGDNSLKDFGKELENFGDSISSYAKKVKDLDTEAVESSAAAGQMLADIANSLPNEGGIVSKFAGDSSLSDFAEQLPELGKSMKQYAKKIKGIDDGMTTSSEIVVNTIAAFAAIDIPSEGGLIGFFSGNSSLKDFAKQLPDVAKDISKFADKSSDLEDSVLDKADILVSLLSKFLNIDMPNKGGLVELFTGSTLSLSDFSSQIGDVAKNLSDFSDKADGLDDSILSKADIFVSLLSKFLNIDMPTEGGLIDLIAGGSVSLSDFAEQLPTVATAVNDFAKNSKDLGDDTVNKADVLVSTLSKFSEESIGNISDMSSVNSAFDSFCESIQTLSGCNFDSDAVAAVVEELENLKAVADEISQTDLSGLSTFPDSLSQVSTDGIDKFIESIEGASGKVTTAVNSIINAMTSDMSGKSKDFKQAGRDYMQQLINGLKSEGNNVSSSLKSILKSCVSDMKVFYQDFKQAGRGYMQQLINGLKSEGNNVSSSLKSILKSCVSDIKVFYQDFKQAGKYLVQGFADGISKNTYLATAKSRAMAKSAAKAATKELDEHSPSKVGFRIGNNFGVGFVNGIATNIAAAFGIGSDIAGSAVSGLDSAVSQISDFVTNGVGDIQPTITPVLDLADVKSGINSMNGMFADQQSLAFAFNSAGSISNSMNGRINQNDQFGDLLGAINKLNKRVGDIKGDTYNVGGVTYDDGSNIATAVGDLVHAVRIGKRA